MHKRFRSNALIAVIFAVPGLAVATVPEPEMPQAGGLLLYGADSVEAATLVNTDVNIAVNGLVARVSVMQEFANTSDDWVEGVYVFPLPDAAAVDHMRLYIGDRFIEGEIREKQQARQEYEQAKSAGKKTSLVEQQKANLFRTSVANIAPLETVIVEIEYLQDLHYDAGTFSLRFPMTITPRYQPGGLAELPLPTPPMAIGEDSQQVSLQATVNAGMPLAIVASRYHPVSVAAADGLYMVSLAGGRAPMDHDFELLWRPVPQASPRALLFAETIGRQPHYLLMVVPPESDPASNSPQPRDMIFIIDTSGSMHGVSLQQAKEALQRAIDGLHPTDQFNVVEFNSTTRPFFQASVAANAMNVSAAKNFVRQLQPNGGTEMRPALEYALRTAPSAAYLRQIIFITDGAVGNEEELFALIDSKLGNARLFTVGIGSAPNSWFMRKAAEAGRGTFTTIGALHEVGEKMDRLFRKLESPQVTDIDVQWPGSVIVESYPQRVPDLYRGEPVVLKARLSGEARPGDLVRVSGNSLGGAWGAELALGDKVQSNGIGALWARARLADLQDQLGRGADAETVRSVAVETALAHHLVSRYTSLVAVDKTPARTAGELLRQEQLANRTPRGQLAAAGFAFPATATRAPALLLGGFATVLLALLLAFAPRALGGRVDERLA